MIFDIIDCEQGTEEWFKARLGKITASDFDKIITGTGKFSTSHNEIVNKNVAEILTGEVKETFQSESMNRGTYLEKEALKFFNIAFDYKFEKTGFFDSRLGYGCSPDGVDLDLKIGLELKCPESHTHVGYLAEDDLPKKYYQQVQGSLLVSGFDTWIFGSYHPALPPVHVIVKRDEPYIEKLREYLNISVKLINERHDKILKRINK